MLEITDRAMTILEEIRDLGGAEEAEGVVLYREDDGGVGFGIGTAGEADQVVEREGRAVVIVAEELRPLLDGLVLDFVPGDDAGEFTLVQP